MITLYTKTGCYWCVEVVNYLKQQGIQYDEVIVSNDRNAMQAMIELSGQTKAPTMDYDGKVLADFGVEELIPFLKEHGIQ